MNVPCKSQIKCFAVIFYLSMNSLVQLTCTVNGKKKKNRWPASAPKHVLSAVYVTESKAEIISDYVKCLSL